MLAQLPQMIRLPKPFNHFEITVPKPNITTITLGQFKIRWFKRLSSMWNSLLDADNERKAIAKRYLMKLKWKNHLTNGVNWWKEAIQSRFHLFVIRTQNRIDLQDYLHQNGIQTVIHYPVPPHNQKALSFWTICLFYYPKNSWWSIGLPISPVLTMEEVSYIVSVLNKY
jgi:dTDP-4-amino-4,6-dideoxygalactose transaminase